MSDTDETGDEDIDPEELQKQLAAIQGAIGLEDRYPGQRRLWLLYGSIVGAASVIIELLFAAVQRGPNWFYQGVWLAFVGIAGLALWRLATGTPREAAPETAPDWRGLFGALLLAAVALTAMSIPILERLEPVLSTQEWGLLTGSYYYSLMIAVAGLGFLFTGNALRAYRIRARDRRVFYGAGVWMLVYAAIFPQTEFTRIFGYAIFGVLFLLYSVGAYLVLGNDDEGDDGSTIT